MPITKAYPLEKPTPFVKVFHRIIAFIECAGKSNINELSHPIDFPRIATNRVATPPAFAHFMSKYAISNPPISTNGVEIRDKWGSESAFFQFKINAL
jgi:hypothetical protein